MKVFTLCLLVLSINSYSKEKKNFDKFNKSLLDNISIVINHNPEIYEEGDKKLEKKSARTPASIIEFHDDGNAPFDQGDEQAGAVEHW